MKHFRTRTVRIRIISVRLCTVSVPFRTKKVPICCHPLRD